MKALHIRFQNSLQIKGSFLYVYVIHHTKTKLVMWRTTILAKRCVQKSNHTVKTSTVVPYQAHVMPKMNYELTVSKKEKKNP